MWLAKPIYEALPYYYIALGVVALSATLYVDYWYWPAICRVVGVLGVAAGVFVWIKRRSARAQQR